MKFQHLYYVYIVLCSDSSFYVGITNNLDRRMEEHNLGINTKCYTFTKRPLELKYFETYQNVHEAINREKQLKGWSRKKKIALINGEFDKLIELSKSKKNT